SGPASLGLTYLFLVIIMGVGAVALRLDLKKFLLSFTVIFAISFVCWFLGHYVPIAATPDKRPPGVTWSLSLTGEAGYIIALLAGLAIGNFLPGVTESLKEGTRPEWFIKTAIVIMGAALGVKAAGATGLASAIMLRGLAAIIEAYLIYWALVYFI